MTAAHPGRMYARDMLRRIVIAAFLVLAAEQVAACSMKSWEPDELVENTPEVSANGRFQAVVRWYEHIPDFKTARAGEPRENTSRRETVVAALYEGRRKIAELPLHAPSTGQVLISDSGRYLIATNTGRACGGFPRSDDTVVTIYRNDGARIGTLTYADVLSASDAAQMGFGFGGIEHFGLRQERDGREVVVLTFDKGERRIDVATGALLDERRNMYPVPRVFVTPVRATDSPRLYQPISPECSAAFAEAAYLGSERFFSHAVDMPLPPFPVVAMKAKIRGPIRLELLVSETGDVLCMRRSSLPFGIDQAADDSVPRWKFTPYVVDGRAAKFAGELVLRFEDVLDRASP
jgi:Gram-negative bacterial TonB protein C-terminal